MNLSIALQNIALVLSTATAAPRVADLGPCPARSGDSWSFDFASNPWLNLYNFLFESAKQARGIDDEGLGARGYVSEDTAAVRPLSSAEHRVWNDAVDFFARTVVTDRMGVDSLVQSVNDVLARLEPNVDLDTVPLHPELRSVLLRVMPIYRTAWWPAHDRRNRLWITEMQRGLAERTRCLVPRAEGVFRAPWPAGSIHVDATVYANWFGAYSTHPPTRITVSANAVGSQGSHGVEVLLHEAAHDMLVPLDSALCSEAARRNKRLPSELSHLVLFYTAGALMKEGDPAYLPFAEEFGVWRQSGLAKRYHTLIEQEWQPYLSGERNFGDALAALVQRLP